MGRRLLTLGVLPARNMLYGDAMQDELVGQDPLPLPPLLRAHVIRLVAAAVDNRDPFSGAGGDDWDPVIAIVEALIHDGTLVFPVKNLSPEAEARAKLARFSGLPPPPEVPGLTTSREDAPQSILDRLPKPPPDDLPVAHDGDTARLGAWAADGVPLSPEDDPDV